MAPSRKIMIYLDEYCSNDNYPGEDKIGDERDVLHGFWGATMASGWQEKTQTSLQ